jgi:IPT/TIG domain
MPDTRRFPLLLSLSLTLLAGACGGGSDPIAPPVEPPPAGPPTISAISPASGIATTRLTLTGTNFTSAADVRIGTVKANIISASATSLIVDLCDPPFTDCEPKGAIAAGGKFGVTVSVGAQSATAPKDYHLYTSATFLAGEWRTTQPLAAAGIISKFDAAGRFGVLQIVPPGTGAFVVGDTVNRAITRTAAYRWTGQGLLINNATGERLYDTVSITVVDPDLLEIQFAIGGTPSRRARVNPVP